MNPSLPETPQPSEQSPTAAPTTPPRRGAIGKAFIVYLLSGSVGLAVVAFLVFRGMSC